MATELLAPDELPDLIESDDYKALPYDQRQKVLGGALGEAHQWQAANGGWTADSWKQFGELASVARQRVTESETFGEKTKAVAGTIGGVVKDSAVSMGLMAAGSQPGMDQVAPVGRNLAINLERGRLSVMEHLRQQTGPETNWLEGDLKVLKKDIDEGNIPFGDQAKLDEWLRGHDDTITKDAAAYHTKVGKQTPDEAAKWSRDNGLLGNPKNAALLSSYMQTRDPAALDALRSNLLTTQGRAGAALAQASMNKASLGGKALDATGLGSEMLAEAGDPLEVAGMVLPLIKGANVVQKGVSVGRKVGTVAAATAGEVASELGSQFIDDPNATWEQRAQVAKETLYGTLGLAGIGAAAGKMTQAKEPPVSAQSPAQVVAGASGSGQAVPGSVPPATSPQPLPVADAPSTLPDLQEHTGDLTAEDVADLEAPPVVAGLTEPGQEVPGSPPPVTALEFNQSAEDLAVVEAAHAAGEIDAATLAEARAGYDRAQARSMQPNENATTTGSGAVDTATGQPALPAVLAAAPAQETLQQASVTDTTAQPGTVPVSAVSNGPESAPPNQTVANAIGAGSNPAAGAPKDFSRPSAADPVISQLSGESSAPPSMRGQAGMTGPGIEAGQPPPMTPGGAAASPGVAPSPIESRKGFARRGVNIPARTDGVVADLVDFVKREGMGRPPRLERDRMGRPLNQRGEHDALRTFRREMPAHYAALTREGGRDIDTLAQQAYEEGLISQPDVDEFATTLRRDLDARRQQGRDSGQRDKTQAKEEKALLKEGARQNAAWAKATKPKDSKLPVKTEQLSLNDVIEVNGEPLTVVAVELDDQGNVDRVTLEDGRKFGRQQMDAGELVHVDDSKPAPDEFLPPHERDVPHVTGFKNLDVSGKTAGFLNTDIINEGADLIARGVRDFAVWSRAMVQRFGAAIRDYLQGVWQQITTRQMPKMGGGKVTERRPEGGFIRGPQLEPRETQSRFARPEADERLYQVRADVDVKAAALEWVDSVPLDAAVAQLESGSLPDGMTDDVGQRAAAEVLMRTGEIMRSGTEVQRLQARSLSHRMGKVWQGWMSQEAGRNLRQRAVANAEMQPFAPILAAENVLIDRADAVVSKRFEGGATTGAQKVKKVADDSGKKAGENLGGRLDGKKPSPDTERKTAPVKQKLSAAQRTAESIINRLAETYADPSIWRDPRAPNPIRALYNEHIARPMGHDEFVNRMMALGVPENSASRLHTTSQLEIAAIEEIARVEAQQAAQDLARDESKLAKMLNDLRRKMAPGMAWADIFTELPSAQKERQRAIYQRLQLDERLKGLSAAERLALTNELDKAWQRERRKVFNRELEKAGVLGEKDASDRAKVQKAMPRLLRMINLGMMNSEMFREAIAPEYGLRMLSGDEALKLRTLAEDAWKLPEGVLRNRKLGDLLAGIQKATGASTAELLNHYWVASVLSGLRTMFDTFMSSMNGFGTNLIQAGQLIATGKGKAGVAAHMQWWAGLSQGVSESVQILQKGDYSFLKRFNEDMRRALDGEGTFRPVPLGESLWQNGIWWQKYGMAPVMIWTGRLMAAADHINNTATSQGAMAAARALHPELYKGANAWTDAERFAARNQALREVTGGSEPTTRADAATISARTREILNGNVTTETRAEGNFIGDQAAYQNDPIGVLGGVYQMMNAGLGAGERAMQGVADKIGSDGRAGAFAKASLTWASGALRSVAGAKFIRFGANFGNDMMGYMPGTYLLSRAGQSLDLIERTRSQNALLLGKNVFGLVAASTVAAMFADKDDDEAGWHLEGSWNGMTAEQKAQRRTAGMEPLSFWKRDGSKVQRVSYRSWPTAGIMVAVGSMADERRFDPVKFKHRGVAGHLLHALTAGALQVKDVNAVRGLAELFGASAMSADPEADFMERLLKLPLNYIGGVVPTAVKDLDALRDARMYQPDGVFEELARNVPGVRQQVSGGRPKLNKLGEPIELDRKPWSRAYTNMESGSAHRVLGSLLARGLDLPSASSDRMVFDNGARVPLKSLGAEVEYKFQKCVGEGYKQWLASDEGRALLTMPVEQAAKVIERKATTIKMMAALAATGK